MEVTLAEHQALLATALERLSPPDGATFRYSHNAQELRSLVELQASPSLWYPAAAYTYDADGDLEHTIAAGTYGNRDWTYPSNGAHEPQTYVQDMDPDGTEAEGDNGGGGTAGDRTTTLEWGHHGRLASATTASVATDYTYDDPEPSASGGDPGVTADDSVPPEVFDPDEGDDDPGEDQPDDDSDVDGVLADVLAATEDAGGGTVELVDDVNADQSRSAGTFQQDPPAFTVQYPAADGRVGGQVLVVDGTTYDQEGDGPWVQLDPGDGIDVDSDVLLDAGALPAPLLEIVYGLGEPTELDPESGRLFQWESTSEQLGVNSDYGDAPATVDVTVDDEDRATAITITVEGVSETLDGGTLSILFTYEDVPEITAPAVD
jgi:hypothetical protein